MAIASEIEDLQTNLAAAKAAVTAKGGTVGNTGLAGLATEIASIPSGGGPSVPQTLYGSALVYPFASKTYAPDPNNPSIQNCTINSIDQTKLAKFAEQYPPEAMGEEVMLNFDYGEDYDNPGNYIWRYYYEDPDTGFQELKIAEADMLSTTGIDVTVTSGETWAQFTLIETVIVNSNVTTWVNVLDANEYNYLAIRSYDVVNPDTGDTETVTLDPNTYTIGGIDFYHAQIKEFAFGTSNTTIPGSGEDGFLRGCNNLTTLHFDYVTSITSIGDCFLRECTSFNQALTIPNTVTSIGQFFLSGCTSFNQSLVIPNNVTTIGDYFLSECSSFNQSLTLPTGLTSIPNGFLAGGCIVFNQSITIPSGVTSIGYSFLTACNSFNQPLTIPSSVRSIGSDFLSNCTSFNQPFTLPSTVTSVGTSFLTDCNSLVSTVTLEAPATVSTDSYYPQTLATHAQTAACYTTGITVAGTYASAWKTKFPNRTSNPYRKLILAS